MVKFFFWGGNNFGLGAAKFLKERLFDVSDFYRIHVCKRCGGPAIANLKNNEYRCERCKDGDAGSNSNIVAVNLPYACKLLLQELGAMQIGVKFHTNVI
jgi:DNA-directed RNA polymerase II subunit RPB2